MRARMHVHTHTHTSSGDILSHYHGQQTYAFLTKTFTLLKLYFDPESYLLSSVRTIHTCMVSRQTMAVLRMIGQMGEESLECL